MGQYSLIGAKWQPDTLDRHLIIVSDYEECTETKHGCDHRCVEEMPGYSCACNVGYSLQSDGKTCKGTVIDRGEEHKLFQLLPIVERWCERDSNQRALV